MTKHGSLKDAALQLGPKEAKPDGTHKKSKRIKKFIIPEGWNILQRLPCGRVFFDFNQWKELSKRSNDTAPAPAVAEPTAVGPDQVIFKPVIKDGAAAAKNFFQVRQLRHAAAKKRVQPKRAISQVGHAKAIANMFKIPFSQRHESPEEEKPTGPSPKRARSIRKADALAKPQAKLSDFGIESIKK